MYHQYKFAEKALIPDRLARLTDRLWRHNIKIRLRRTRSLILDSTCSIRRQFSPKPSLKYMKRHLGFSPKLSLKYMTHHLGFSLKLSLKYMKHHLGFSPKLSLKYMKHHLGFYHPIESFIHHLFCIIKLTLSKTSPCLYVSAVQIF